MKCFYAVFWSEVVILSFAGTFWTADGENVTWYEPPPEETLSDHNLDHKLKTVRLLEGVTDSPLSWNFSFSSDLTFDGLTVNFNGVNVAGVRSSGQAGLVNPSDQRYSFSWTATEKFTLIISNVTDADSGMFTCLVDLCLGFACNDWGSTIKVEVVEPPSISNISMNQTVIVCKDVKTLNLYCIAVGKPAPNVTWIKVSDNRTVTFPLNISGEGDEGTYRCTADNGVGNSVTRDVFITVLECPKLTFVSRDPVVCEDSTVTLSCNATGKPTPNITWTRVTVNGTTDSVPLHPVVDGTFLISNINRSSNGSTYRCTATNGVGDPVNRTVTVTVRHSAAVDRIDTSSKSVIEGDSFNMTCVTSGDPEPNVYWIKVNNSARINGSVWNFTNINRNDSGLYRCEAENRCGNGSRFHFIDVFYPPAITHISRAKNFSFVLDQNETITLNCSAIGNPSPNVTWEKDNLVVTFPLNITGKHDEGNYTCVASNDVGDSATETVSVIIDKYHPFNTILTSSENPVVVNSTFNLSCTAQANPPAKYIFYRGQEILNISQNDESVAVLETSVGERIDKVNYRCTPSNDYGYGKTDEELVTVNYPPVIINNQSVVNITRTENKTLNCEVQGNPRPGFIWINDSSGHVLSYESVLEFINAEDFDTGSYSCNVTSPLGFDSSTIVIRVTRDAIPVDLTVSEEYQSEYADLNNAKTKAFLKPLQDEVVKRFAKNPNFGNAEVIGVRSGSVIVSFVLKFTTPVTLDEGLKDLRSVEGKKIGPYTVTSLAVVDEESPTAGTSGSTNAPVTTAKKTTQRVLEDRPPWAIIGGTIGAAVVVIIVLLVAWWVHKKRKCVKDTKIHNSESEVLNGQNDIEDGSHARVNGGYNGHYADSGPPSANGSNKFVQPQLQPEQQQQQQEAAAPPAHAEVDKSKKKNRDKKNGNENIPDYAVVDKSKKKKKNPEVEDPYAEVEDPKKDKKTADPATHDYAVVNKSKKKKKEEDENAYATVDKSKKSKKGQQKPKAPGEVLYADLGDFQPVQPLPTVSTSPEPLAPIKRPTPYEGTEYADITQFLKGNATLPEGQSTEMQPTYANAGGGQGAAANKENANTGGKGGGGDTEPKETPM